MIAAIWILTALGLIVWSLVAWGVHALLGVDPAWVGDLAPLIDKIPYGEVIDAWFPGWRDLLQLSLDIGRAVLGWLGGAAPVMVGVIWAVGAVLLLALAGLLHLIVALLTRGARAVGGAAPGSR